MISLSTPQRTEPNESNSTGLILFSLPNHFGSGSKPANSFGMSGTPFLRGRDTVSKAREPKLSLVKDALRRMENSLGLKKQKFKESKD